MEREITAMFNKEFLKSGASKFGIDVEKLALIGGFQNFIYQYSKDGIPCILRATHSSHRSEDMMKGELDWVLYLSNNGVIVSKPVYSLSDSLTERVDAGDSYFIFSSFEKAPGRRLNYPEYLGNDDYFVKLGEITGKMHALSKRYIPKDKSVKRHNWTDNYYIKNIENFIPREQHEIHKSCKELLSEISKLNKACSSYGLIHGDINLGNFLLDGDKITLFDFDECQYSWFVEDIAIQLFYSVYVILDDTIDEREEMAARFMDKFMESYRRENLLDNYWIKQLPLFLRLREIIVHVGMYRSWDFNDLNQWQKDYIRDSKNRIENGIPLVNSIF